MTACDINLRHHTFYRVTAYDVHRARQGLQVQALGVSYLDDSSLTLKRPWMSDGPDVQAHESTEAGNLVPKPRRKVRDDLDGDCIQCQMSEDQCFTTCDDQVNGYGHYEMDLQLVCLGASPQPIIDFFNTCRTLYDKERESLITEPGQYKHNRPYISY